MPNSLVLQKDKGFYRIPLLDKFKARGFITTRFYNMVFADGSDISDRRQAYRAMGVKANRVICPDQVHGDHFCFVTGAHKGRGCFKRKTAVREMDAIVTNVRRLPVGVLTADCLPILILDRRGSALALIHAGWRGIQKRIVYKTVRAMVDYQSVETSCLLAVIGPSIRSCCYEVGKEFSSFFGGFLIYNGKSIYLDLQSAAIKQLVDSGIDSGSIYDSLICTCCHNKEFFSYRKEGISAGRGMFVVEML